MISNAKRCHHLDPEVINRMEALVTGRTDETLMAQFGISYNTWRKVIAGQPIRASLRERLLARIEALEAGGFGQAN